MHGHAKAPDQFTSPCRLRAPRELLGYTDVTTTMVYTHVLTRGGKGVRRPTDTS